MRYQGLQYIIDFMCCHGLEYYSFFSKTQTIKHSEAEADPVNSNSHITTAAKNMFIQVIWVIHFSDFTHVHFHKVHMTIHTTASQHTEMCLSGQALEKLGTFGYIQQSTRILFRVLIICMYMF